MNKGSKLLSAILSFVLTCTLLPAPAFGAVLEEDSMVGTDAISEAIEDNTGDHAANETTSEGWDLPSDEGDDAEAQAQNVSLSEASLSSENQSADAIQYQEGDLSLIEYVYIESAEVNRGETQNIVVGFSDVSLKASEAVLRIREYATDAVYTINASKSVAGAVLFTFGTNTYKESKFEVLSIQYAIEVSASNDKVEVFFTDDDKVTYTFDVVAAADPMQGSAEDIKAYTIDGDGSLTEEGSIQEAIKSAKEAAPATVSAMARTGELVVALDPGHGGTEPGAVANGLVERDVNLSIAQYCREELEKYSGVKVIMTRAGDQTVGLHDRVTIAVNNGAHVFVSIHCNSGSEAANGAEVYYPREDSSFHHDVSTEGKGLSQHILNNLVDLGLTNRGIKTRPGDGTYADGSPSDYYAVIRDARNNGIPGIIVEHAFLTNPTDSANLKDQAFLRKLGIADATGIAQQYGLIKANEAAYQGAYDYTYYRNNNLDLIVAYGDSRSKYLEHFLEWGLPEGRQASPVFSINYYKNRYADLRAAYGNELERYCAHFASIGMSEGRQGSDKFDVNSYYNQYSDTRNAYKFSPKSYYMHFINYGFSEKRSGVGCATIQGATTTRGGVNYAPVYDGAYYAANNSDVKSSCTKKVGYASFLDDSALLAHFVNYGMAEGRRGSDSFDVASYYNAHADVRTAMGANPRALTMHYLNYGKREGRAATGATTLRNYVTTRGGVNYAPVYDGAYYAANNPDVKAAYTKRVGNLNLLDDSALLAHFVNYGMNEGRRGNAAFDVASYYNANSDVRNAYGTALTRLYSHYLNYGRREGRAATGVSSLRDYVTIRGGVNYAPVYDGAYYAANNPDVKASCVKHIRQLSLLDDTALLAHFVNYGMTERRWGSSAFDVNSYYNANPDVRRTYGTNWKGYYLHYINYGKREGRPCLNCNQIVTDDYSAIMGPSEATVDKMVRFYNSRGVSYPAGVYAKYGAANITQFCQIIAEEAAVEGVRAEVVFAQAMHETGFLQYGGDVDPEQCNFAGIGATGGGNPGNSFNDWGANSVRKGLRVQIQHLKAYASTAPLAQTCVDPRFYYVSRGCAPSVYDLGGKWATGAGYGQKVMSYVDGILKS